MIEKIEALIKARKKLAKQAVVQFSVLVDDMLRTQSTDQKLIEHTLDRMLDFCFDDEMLLQYKKLCRHYFTINPTATAFYINSYREMWDDESSSNKELVI